MQIYADTRKVILIFQIICKFNLFMAFKNIHEEVVLEISFVYTTYNIYTTSEYTKTVLNIHDQSMCAI